MGRLLLVACQFAPDATVATRRALRIARAMRDRGWQVDVLAQHPRFAEQRDEALLDDLDGVAIHYAEVWSARAWAKIARDRWRGGARPAPPSPPAERGGAGVSGARAGVAAALRAGTRQLSDLSYRHLALPDAYVGWWAPAALHGLALRRPDVVLATLPPPTAALVGATLGRRFGAPLVLDYRDPWTGRHDHAELPAWRAASERRMEAAILRQAAGVCATTPGIADDLRRRGASAVAWIPNACEPERLAGVQARAFSAPTLVYTGGVYGGRSLLPTFRAMARLRAAGQPTPRLCYLGTTGAEVEAEATLAGVRDLVDIDGPRPYADALAATAGASANVCVVADVHARQVPAKLFEQIAAGRPIVLLTPLPSDAADLAEGVAGAMVLAHGDDAGLDAALRHIATAAPDAAPAAVPPHLTVDATMDALAELLARARAAR